MGLKESLGRAFGLASPWAEPNSLDSLPPLIVSDMWPESESAPVTRAEAMSVPAVARCRNLICGTVARLPLYAERGGEKISPPIWLDRSDGEMSPYLRMLLTVDDLLFYGASLWRVKRGADTAVIDARRVPFDRWNIEHDGAISIDARPVASDEVVFMPGSHEGILRTGAAAIRHARTLLDAVAKAAQTPAPQIELHQTNDAPLPRERAEEIRQTWIDARRGKNGGVAFTTSGIEVINHGAPIPEVLNEGRNAAAIDIARICGVPAPMIDASISGSSLSYTNTGSRMAELITFGLSPTMAAIAARLGMDDVSPRGTRIVFDTTETLAPVTNFAVPDDQPTPNNGDVF